MIKRSIQIIAIILAMLIAHRHAAFSEDYPDISYPEKFFVKSRIYFNPASEIDGLQRLGIAIDKTIIIAPDSAEIVLDKYEFEKLSASGYRIEILNFNPEKVFRPPASINSNSIKLSSKYYQPGSMGGYFTYDEISSEFERMKNLFPELISEDTIGYSINRQPIVSYRFGLHSDSDLPNTLFTALHHGREPGGATTIFYFLWDLLDKYERNDDEALFLLNNRTLFVVPVVNPDGYLLNNRIDSNGNARGGGLWRKNRRMINDSVFGVDLNRNYGPQQLWDAPNNGSEIDPAGSTYRGGSPFSEPETQALRDLCNRHKFNTALNFHTYGEVMVFPYGALQREPDDSLLYRGLGKNIHSKNKYVFGFSDRALNYRARGTAEDYMYFTHGTIAATPEIGNYIDRFWASSPQQIIDDGIKNLYMSYQFLWGAGYNIRPNDVSVDFSMPGAPVLIVEIQNIGAGGGSVVSDLTITALDEFISVSTPVRAILPLEKAGKQIEKFRIAANNGFRNGESVKFEVLLAQDGVQRRDTFEFALFYPIVLNLYDGGEMSEKWISDGWGLEYDPSVGGEVLTDSPNALYGMSESNFLYYNEEISLINYRNALLSLETKWGVETKYDLCVVQASTDQGETWEYLYADRMVHGISTQKGRIQQTGTMGFHGFFKDYLVQDCPLKRYIGSNILLRFGLLSDLTNVYNGWFLQSVKILLFDEVAGTIGNTNRGIGSIAIAPSPVRRGDNLIIGFDEFAGHRTSKIVVYDILGNEVIHRFLNNLRELSIPTNNLLPGQYVLRIDAAASTIFKRILVID